MTLTSFVVECSHGTGVLYSIRGAVPAVVALGARIPAVPHHGPIGGVTVEACGTLLTRPTSKLFLKKINNQSRKYQYAVNESSRVSK